VSGPQVLLSVAPRVTTPLSRSPDGGNLLHAALRVGTAPQQQLGALLATAERLSREEGAEGRRALVEFVNQQDSAQLTPLGLVGAAKAHCVLGRPQSERLGWGTATLLAGLLPPCKARLCWSGRPGAC
jgi:hypothetical protein